MELAERLELHYYLSSESHSMDAYVRNKCELEILAIIQEIAEIAGVEFKLETEAYVEGGLKEAWKAIGENGTQIAVVMSAAAIVISLLPSLDFEGKALQNELTRLSIEEKNLTIQKLKQELGQNKPSKDAAQALSDIANDSFKILVRKSNFYKSLSNYPKVEKVGLSPLSKDRTPLAEELIVERKEFRRFILSSNKLPPEAVDNAEIEIVAPVIHEGNFQWKGIYNEETIPFRMNDVEFQEAVLRKDISFQNGSTIICALSIHKKLDEVGEVVITGYSVDTVIEKIDGETSLKTEQGKRHLADRKVALSQGKLFEE